MNRFIMIFRSCKVVLCSFFNSHFILFFIGNILLFSIAWSWARDEYLQEINMPQGGPLFYTFDEKLSRGGSFYYNPIRQIIVSYFDSENLYSIKGGYHRRMSNRNNCLAIGLGKDDRDFICGDRQIYILTPSAEGIEIEQFPYQISLFLEKFLENNWKQSGKSEHRIEVLNYTFKL